MNHVRTRIVIALAQLATPSSDIIQALLVRLTDENFMVRYNASIALGKLSRNSDDAIDAVTKWILQHQNSEFVDSGINALWEIVVGNP